MNSYTLDPIEVFATEPTRKGGESEGNDTEDYTRSEVYETNSFQKRSRTFLPNGNSMLVDLGSRINLVGRETLEDFVAVATEHGMKSVLKKRVRPLLVNGVGAGSAPCNQVLEVPIAVKYGNSPKAQVMTYHANVAEGCGSKLPAILGLDSMTEKDAVLILRNGKRCMAFPGKGGYKIEWSPGTRLLPLETSPSGHLVIPCDAFQGATEDVSQTFITDHTVVERPSETQTAQDAIQKP